MVALCEDERVRRPAHALSTLLITAGLLVLLDAGLTLAYQEPMSALYATVVQDRLGDDLRKLEKAKRSAKDMAALRSLKTEHQRIAFLARSWRRKVSPGGAAGRIRIPKIKASHVVVNGTDKASLRKGPGLYESNPFPGAPGTVAIAGHRTTYLAPFRDLDELRKGDEVRVEMPYARFVYRVERTRIVDPHKLSVVRRVSYDRLVLSACHPLFSAKQRIIVFARIVRVVPV